MYGGGEGFANDSSGLIEEYRSRTVARAVVSYNHRLFEASEFTYTL